MEHFDGNKSQRLRDAVLTLFLIAAAALAIGASFILAPFIGIGAGWIFLAIVFSAIGYTLAMPVITSWRASNAGRLNDECVKLAKTDDHV